jgi:hypothetical protein
LNTGLVVIFNDILLRIKKEKKYVSPCRICDKPAIRHIIYGQVLPRLWSSALEASVCSNPACEAELRATMTADFKSKREEKMIRHHKVCKTCESCEGKMLTCAGCKFEYYCSAACQKKDWPNHKAVCKAAQKSK